MRPIDADALIKILKPHGLRNGAALGWHSGLADAVIDEIRKLPTIGGWISVKDRLPPMGKCVLVFCKGKSEHVQSVRTITEMSDINRFNYKCKTEPYWREPWDFFYANYDITHWMPLPEPPQEDE